MLLYHFGSRDGLLLEVARAVETRTKEQFARIGRDLVGDDVAQMDVFMRRMWDYVADPELAGFERLFFSLYARALQDDEAARPLLAGDIARWLDTNDELSAATGFPARAGRAHARLGLAVTRGLLLDLLATGDRAGVDEAMEVFASRYSGRWWEDEAPAGTSDRAS
jgi:AcrR family transcriptional regulator